jgi:MFS family permease
VSSAPLILTDRGLALSEPKAVGAQGGTKMLAALSLGSCLVFVSSAVVTVALAAIGRDMRLSPLDLRWVMNAELLPLAALTLVAGALGDRFGQKRIFLAGSLSMAWARPRLGSRRVSRRSSSAGSCKAWAKP